MTECSADPIGGAKELQWGDNILIQIPAPPLLEAKDIYKDNVHAYKVIVWKPFTLGKENTGQDRYTSYQDELESL